MDILVGVCGHTGGESVDILVRVCGHKGVGYGYTDGDLWTY